MYQILYLFKDSYNDINAYDNNGNNKQLVVSLSMIS